MTVNSDVVLSYCFLFHFMNFGFIFDVTLVFIARNPDNHKILGFKL